MIASESSERITRPVVVWLMRLMLSVLMSFGSELLLWNDLPAREVIDWLLVLIGMLVISTISIDLLIRLRLRDLPGLMTLAGVYALLNALVINPDSTLFDIPRTLVTRVTGAHALIGLEMLILFLALLSGRRGLFQRVVLFGAVVVGLAWGTWVRWAVTLDDGPQLVFDSTAILVTTIAAGLMVFLMITLIIRRGAELRPEEVLMTRAEWFAAVIILLVMVMIQLGRGTLPSQAMLIVGILLVLCYAMLWFRRSTRLEVFADQVFPPQRFNPLWLLATIGLFIASAATAYDAPEFRAGDLNQLSIIVYGFTLYGLAWLPTVSLWLGMRAYLRQVMSRQQ